MLILPSTGQRAAGACTCNRSSEENTVSGDKCACGKGSSSMTTPSTPFPWMQC